ncbi:MAG: SDR family oxidoreductase [Halobacteriales archaeon]|nr:SDR family oxidoreductase [Halobacteriales archaeon]
MRILVTGAAGLVGSRAARVARDRGHDVHLAYHDAPLAGVGGPWHALDRARAEQVRSVLEATRAEAILDCAAWTDVDGCERDPERAMLVNGAGSAHVADEAGRRGARVVHVGTDFVFRGDDPRPRTELDAPGPQSAYARSKLAGEQAVLAHAQHAVVRASVLYGWHPRKLSFPAWVVRELRAGRGIRVVRDQRASPTPADSLAAFLVTCAERDAAGLWHAAGQDCCTRHAFAVATAQAFGLDAGLVAAIPTSDLKLPAARPANSCLDSSKARRELGYAPVGIAEGLAQLRATEPR